MARHQELQTHCKHGHPFDEDNTYIVPSTGHRNCRTCHRQREAERRSKIPKPTKWERAVARFWSKVDKSGTCWEWQATPNGRYGSFTHDNQTHGAHRFAWMIKHGDIPDGMFVCHRCDNPRCVRPSHLFLGEAADNTEDMMKKGRYRSPYNPNPPTGVDHPLAKLNPPKVREMRRLRFEEGWDYRSIAAEFGVAVRGAWLAINGKTWAHVK